MVFSSQGVPNTGFVDSKDSHCDSVPDTTRILHPWVPEKQGGGPGDTSMQPPLLTYGAHHGRIGPSLIFLCRHLEEESYEA